MTNDRHTTTEEPRLRDRLRDDLNETGVLDRLRRDLDDIREFYVTEEKRSRLSAMPWYRRWATLIFWLLKSMLLKLTPARRLLVIAGSVLILTDGVVINTGSTTVSTNWDSIGWVLLIIVLMLELKDRILARSELAEGRGVQRALMPEAFPAFAGWSIALHSEPANEVGGDLVDFIRTVDGRAAVVLGDVSGKGLKAAMMMAKLQTVIRVLAYDGDGERFPMERLNAIFRRESVSGMFASLLLLRIRTDDGAIVYQNAGHLPPLVMRAQGVEESAKGNMALGIKDGADFEERALRLQAGDTFVAFSDGVVEAQNMFKEQFGIDRLKRSLARHRSLPADAMGRSVMNDIAIFVGDARPHDDLSYVILRKL